MESSQAVQQTHSQGRHAKTSMQAPTSHGMHTHINRCLPSSQLEQGKQAMPLMYLTQPSQDTMAWSEETQADPPHAVHAPTLTQAEHHVTMQQELLHSAHRPVTAASMHEEAAQHDSAAAAAVAAPPSRLRMKMKTLAAAAAINNAEAANHASAVDNTKQDIGTSPLLSVPGPEAGLGDHSRERVAPADHPTPCTAEQAAAAEASAEAARAAAPQIKQALAAATAAQDECKAMAMSAAAAATADKENQEGRHSEVLSKIAGMEGSCTALSAALVSLQASSEAQTAKLSAVESTCQTLLGLMHGLSAQTQQAVAAIEAQKVQQPAVTMLRCLEGATQTSPVSVRHEDMQAELAVVTIGPSHVSQKVPIAADLVMASVSATGNLVVHESAVTAALTGPHRSVTDNQLLGRFA